MQDVYNSLDAAHQQLKNIAITSIQNDQDVEPHVLDSIKAIYALKQAIWPTIANAPVQ